MSHAAAIASLKATPAMLQSLFSGLPDDLTTLPLDGGWSPRDVVAHLIITDRLGTFGRIRRILDEDRPDLAAFDEEEELAKSGLRAVPADELVHRFVASRAAGLKRLAAAQAGALERTGRHIQAGDLAAIDLVFHAAYHDALHLRQVLQMIERYFEPLRGRMRMY